MRRLSAELRLVCLHGNRFIHKSEYLRVRAVTRLPAERDADMSLARKIKRQQMRKANRADMTAYYAHTDRVVEDWDKREKELSEERTLYAFSATLAMCCKVLCRDFGFTPLKGGKPPYNSKLARFCRAVEDEVNAMDTRTNEGLQRYMDEAYKVTWRDEKKPDDWCPSWHEDKDAVWEDYHGTDS